jgi:hypothetical protein
LTSGTKCTAAIVLRDENDKRHFLCRSHAAQHLSGNQELLGCSQSRLSSWL